MTTLVEVKEIHNNEPLCRYCSAIAITPNIPYKMTFVILDQLCYGCDKPLTVKNTFSNCEVK